MKNICRDFTIIIGVPDDVKPEDCEIAIVKTSTSYLIKGESVDIPEDQIDMTVDDPYECS